MVEMVNAISITREEIVFKNSLFQSTFFKSALYLVTVDEEIDP